MLHANPFLSRCAFALLLWSCSPSGATDQKIPFAKAFPDPSVLITSPDVELLTDKLDRCDFPRTEKHHTLLRNLLRLAATIDADHLLLLTRAVAPSFSKLPLGFQLSINGEDIDRLPMPRGQGQFDDRIDQLLLAGAPKIDNVTPRDVGRLLGRTQSTAALAELAERFLPRVDDGSVEALSAILEGLKSAQGSEAEIVSRSFVPTSSKDSGDQGKPLPSAMTEFVRDYLSERGRLQGQRALVAISFLSTDEEKTNLILRQLREDDIGKDTPRDLGHLESLLKLLNSSKSRLAVLAQALPNLVNLPPSKQIELAKTLNYDKDRLEVLERFSESGTENLSVDDLHSFLDLLTYGSSKRQFFLSVNHRILFTETPQILSLLKRFPSGSEKAKVLAALLGKCDCGWIRWEDVISLGAAFRSSKEKLAALRDLGKKPSSALGVEDSRRLIRQLPSGKDRIALIELFLEELMKLSESDRRSLLDEFISPEHRQQAALQLGLSPSGT